MQTKQVEYIWEEQQSSLYRVKKEINDSMQMVTYKMMKVDELLNLKEWIRTNISEVEKRVISKMFQQIMDLKDYVKS